MIVNDAKTAHEFANAWWINSSCKRRVRFHLQYALNSQKAIVLTLHDGAVKQNHQEAINVLELYLKDCEE